MSETPWHMLPDHDAPPRSQKAPTELETLRTSNAELVKRLAGLEGALRQIADEAYEPSPVNDTLESWTLAAAQIAKNALAATSSPDMVVVPREPTQAMKAALFAEVFMCGLKGWPLFHKAWIAMVEAALKESR